MTPWTPPILYFAEVSRMRKLICFLICFLVFVPWALCQSAPVITLQPQSQTVTAGSSVTFSVTATGVGNYYWYDSGVLIPGATGSSYTFKAQASDTGSQFVALLRNATGTANAQTNAAILSVVPRTDHPSVSNVENFGTVAASQAAGGFGLNVTSYIDWQFAACKSIHCSWVRFDCPWSSLEIQSMPFNTSAGFALSNSTNCSSGLQSSHSYGLHPNITAYWGPPYSTIAVGTTAADIPTGSKSITIAAFKSGSLSAAVARQTTVTTNSGIGTPTATALYEGGALVDSISGNTMNLARATDIDIPKGSTITVSALLYPPILFSPTQTSKTSYMSNASLAAFDAYAHYLATAIASTGNTGTVELWNEPEQNAECWDFAPNCYDTPPAHFAIQEGSGIAVALSAMSIAPVSNVKYANGWTGTNGAQSIYNPNYAPYFPASIAQANDSYAWESFHVYGNMPEESNWIPSCMQANSNSNAAQNIAFACTPIGGATGSNFKYAASLSLFPQNQGGLRQGITETGICRTCLVQTPTETQVTRFDLRQFLAYQANGVSPVIFFDANGASAFDWFKADETPYPVATAFGSLMTDLGTISGTPVGSITGLMPQVTSYMGYYPLTTASFVGTAPGATQNSVMYVSWQKTYTVPAAGSGGAATPWFTLASPAPVNESIQVASGYRVTAVKDLVTQTTVPYSLASGLLTFAVADDPIEVLLSPRLLTQTISFPALNNTTYGAFPVVLNASSDSGLAIAYSVSGPATLSGSTLTITGAGAITVTASQPGSSSYIAATPVSQTISVAKAAPTVTWATPASFTTGSALTATQLDATATVAGTFTYSPAAGAILPVGTSTLTVTFVPTDSADYNSVSQQTTILVSAAVAVTETLTWATPAPIAYLTPLTATQLNATANVAGTFSYNQPIGRILQAGQRVVTVHFTPANTVLYSPLTAQITIAVTELTPIANAAHPAAITYGTPLSATQLNGTAQTYGKLSYSPGAGTILSAGSHTITTTFTPTDTVDYITLTMTSTIRVTPATPVVTWATPASISASTALSAAQLNASSAAPGAFTYSPAAGTKLAAGTHTLSVTFTPTDPVDYSSVTAQTTITTY
jgi:hypothetical protein